jgi:CRP-like cAMP-binding protein
MPSSGIAAASSDLKSRFLNGLAPPERKTILASATQRRFAANSVATNQGHPAAQLFLLTKGCARHFYITEQGKKLFLKWLGAGDLFGGEQDSATDGAGRDYCQLDSMAD